MVVQKPFEQYLAFEEAETNGKAKRNDYQTNVEKNRKAFSSEKAHGQRQNEKQRQQEANRQH